MNMYSCCHIFYLYYTFIISIFYLRTDISKQSYLNKDVLECKYYRLKSIYF